MKSISPWRIVARLGRATLRRREARVLWTGCKFLIGFALLALVLWQNWNPKDGVGLAQAVTGPICVVPLLLALVLCLVRPLCSFVRWYCLVRAQGLPFTLRDALRLGGIGYWWSTVLPGGIGGDLIKATLLAREHSQRSAAVATVLVDRVAGLVGLFLLAAGVGSMYWLGGGESLSRQPALRLGIACAIVVVASLFLGGLLAGLAPEGIGRQIGDWLGRLPLVGRVIEEFWDALWLYRSRRLSLVGAVFLSVVGHVGFVLTFYFAAQVFFDRSAANVPSLADHFLIIPAGSLFHDFFPSPGGVGGAEYGFGQLYVMVGKPAAQAILGSLAARGIIWASCLAGSLVYLVWRGQPRKP